MATTDILPFATGGSANVESQASYATDSSTTNGFSSGIATSSKLNKVWRQSSFMAAGFANWMVNLGINVPDDGNLTNLVANIQTAFETMLGKYYVDTGTANNYVIATNPATTAYLDGMFFRFKPANTNTATTCYLNAGPGNAPILHVDGTALAIGDIPANSIVSVIYVATASAFYITSIAASQAQQETIATNIAVSATASQLTGTFYSPSFLSFRNPTLTSGTPVTLNIATNLSITAPAGATLGTVSGQSARLYFAVAYNGGTPVLCVCNGFIDETALQSPTTISGTSTSANVLYSSSAVSANSPVRVIGFADVPGNTGTAWGSNPTEVQGAGGAALYGMGGIGNGQTWQNMTSSRSAGSTYYNTTGRTITVCVGITVNNGGSAIPTVNGTALPQFGGDANGGQIGVGLSFPVPIGASYSLSLASASLVSNGWFELR